MSCVAPLKAIIAIKPIAKAKKWGTCKHKPTRVKPIPVTICVKTTKYFFVLYISKNGLHKNLNVHGSIMSDVQKVICVSEMPKPLNISTDTMFKTTKGKPIAK